MKKCRIAVEKTGTGYSAYSPDLDGCVATGATREEVEQEMQEAIAFHLEVWHKMTSRFPSLWRTLPM
jgi:predicted RNase H-like HicB family nuclease